MSHKVHIHHISQMSKIYKREIGMQISVPAMDLTENERDYIYSSLSQIYMLAMPTESNVQVPQ